MAYPDSVEYLYSLGNEVKSIKFGLEGISTLLEALNNPQLEFRTVHVAGTNGKGSTCAMIESGLRHTGIRTGLYTSPHLIEPTERIRIDGQDVTRDEFAAAFDLVHETAERLVREEKLDCHPTYFETVTAMAFILFRDAGVHTAVIETGLGGRLDATNTVSPAICVITPIDFDHETFLGRSIESIAAEKAGILKRGAPGVFAPQRLDALKVLRERAEALGVHTVSVTGYSVEILNSDELGTEFALDGLPISCLLPGKHQVQNAATAALTLMQLGVPNKSIQRGIELAQWPGRIERVSDNPAIILDGAHNPAGARALSAYIREFYSNREVWIVYGAMRDKSVQEIAELLFPLASKVILTAPSQPRAVRPEVLKASSDHDDIEMTADVTTAVGRARAAPPETTVFITGSLYLVGEARALLIKESCS